MNNLEYYFNQPTPYSLNATDKKDKLFHHLSALDELHYRSCKEYKKIVDGDNRTGWFENDLYLPVRLFKDYEIRSINKADIFKTLTSSGTTSQKVSKIYLDRETSKNQTKALIKIMQNYLGKSRLPMLIIDHPSVVKDRSLFSARGAGILGLSNFGRNHCYALNDDMRIDIEKVKEFSERYNKMPIFIFGFTFMIWQYFINALIEKKIDIDLSNAVLVHSGGWKKLENIAVDNDVFKKTIKKTCGIRRIHNFYGMVEQVGSIFVECEEGFLHTPDYADIKIFSASSFKQLPNGQKGVIGVSSILPSSYPGHRLLTEDFGTIYGEDDCKCGKKGKYFHVHGRIPKAEERGCSDTHTEVS
tara:strand:- start:7275 stop:8348 length:1074 start_codon:yes stop_codon:yes gene_type:complete